MAAATAEDTIFRIGADLRWFGRTYRVANLATTTDGRERVNLSLDGATVWVDRAELLRDANARQLEIMTPAEDSAMHDLATLKTDAERRQFGNSLAVAHRLLKGARPASRQERRIAQAIEAARDAAVPLTRVLLPKLNARGWFGPRMPDTDPARATENTALLQAQIEAYAADKASPSIKTHYLLYRFRAHEAKCIPVSDETFRRRIAELPTEETTRARQGERAGNAVAPSRRSYSTILTKSPRAHGQNLIDHTKVALMLIAVRGDRMYEIGRAWLTLSVCSYSTKLMNWVLLCDPPSTATLQLLSRDYAAQYGRFPDAWAHDNGPEFSSHFWQDLNSVKGVDLHARPVIHPRFGSEVELSLGGLDAHLWDNILGGTKAIAHRRKLTFDYEPQRLTVSTLSDANGLLKLYADTHANTPLAGTLETPNQMHERNRDEVGSAPERLITPGRDWDWLSMPKHAHQGKIRVVRGEVTIKGVSYTSRELANLPTNSRVEAHYDPFNRARAMVWVNDGPVYVKASERYDFLNHISESDRRYASQEATKTLGRGADPDAYAEFMAEVVNRQDTLRAVRSVEQRALLAAETRRARFDDTIETKAIGHGDDPLAGITLASVEKHLALAANHD